MAMKLIFAMIVMTKNVYKRKHTSYNPKTPSQNDNDRCYDDEKKNTKENLCLIIFGLFPKGSAPISLFSGPILAIGMMTINMMMTMAMLMMTMMLLMMIMTMSMLMMTNLPIVSPKWFPNGTD